MFLIKNKKASGNSGVDSLGTVLIVLGLLMIFVGVWFNLHSSNVCSNECADRGTQFSEVVRNGEWFNTNDLCNCYFEGKIEGFYMEGLDE